MDEGRSLNIVENLSNKDLNVTMGEENSRSTIETSTIAPPPPFSPPPTSTIIQKTVCVLSPTFQGVINQPITSLFSFQSTDQETPSNEDKEEDEMVAFDELEFDHEE
ncbi:unnamed protein product [Lactuca saligna]|uniref:Uncharacterized protein n=1 Tax=Lactuca saligna TaxID=75948 RepID=A0AA35VGU5_LACSI|nr:unnamed protein product [Lactuca saligna]